MPAEQQGCCQHSARHLLSNPVFHIAVATLSAANCALIAAETNCSVGHEEEGCSAGLLWTFYVGECVFVAVFLLDFALTTCAEGAGYLLSAWGAFDIVFSALGLLSLVIISLPPQPGSTEQVRGPLQDDHGVLSSIAVVRIFRVFRLMRSITFLVQSPEMWTMVNALLGSVRTIKYAVMLFCTIVLTFAVVGVESYNEIGEDWSGVGKAMLALIQVASYDQWMLVMRPVIDAYPVFGSIYVFSYFILVPVVLFSLVTAILTQESLRSAQEDSDCRMAERDKFLATVKAELEELLASADKDKDGRITKAELRSLWTSEKAKDRKARTYLQELGPLEELEEIFDFLCMHDPRHSALTREEFLQNMLRYKQDKVVFLMTIALQHLSTIKRRVLRVECKVDSSLRESREVATATNRHLHHLLGPRLEATLQAEREQDRKRAQRMSEMYNAKVDIAAMRTVFDSVDQSHDGLLNKNEFAMMWKELHGKYPGADFERFWAKADMDFSGSVDFDEFIHIMCQTGWHKEVGAFAPRELQHCDSSHFGNLAEQLERDAEERAQRVAQRVAGEAADRIAEKVRAELAMHAEAAGTAQSQASQRFAAQVADVVRSSLPGMAELAARQVDELLSAHLGEGQVAGHIAEVASATEALLKHCQDRHAALQSTADALMQHCQERHTALQAGLLHALQQLRKLEDAAAGAKPVARVHEACQTEEASGGQALHREAAQPRASLERTQAPSRLESDVLRPGSASWQASAALGESLSSPSGYLALLLPPADAFVPPPPLAEQAHLLEQSLQHSQAHNLHLQQQLQRLQQQQQLQQLQQQLHHVQQQQHEPTLLQPPPPPPLPQQQRQQQQHSPPKPGGSGLFSTSRVSPWPLSPGVGSHGGGGASAATPLLPTWVAASAPDAAAGVSCMQGGVSMDFLTRQRSICQQVAALEREERWAQ